MADLGEAFNTLKFYNKSFQTIDYFFTQRSLVEEQEYIDKNMNRKNKKVKTIHNFLALNIPTTLLCDKTTGKLSEDNLGFDIEVFGDQGFHYKGNVTSYQGIVPNFMIPLKGDNKIFVHVNYKYKDTNALSQTQDGRNNNNNIKKFISFIEVPKRFKNINTDDNESIKSQNDNDGRNNYSEDINN
jgi:hypothetical protein